MRKPKRKLEKLPTENTIRIVNALREMANMVEANGVDFAELEFENDLVEIPSAYVRSYKPMGSRWISLKLHILGKPGEG